MRAPIDTAELRIRITGVNLESRCGYVLFVPTERMDARKIVCPFCQEVLKRAR